MANSPLRLKVEPIDRRKYSFLIGIDCGVNTGICVWDRLGKKIQTIQTVLIHHAMDIVRDYHRGMPGKIMVRVEDARQATFKRGDDAYKAQGAGSVMRDAKVWEDFLTDLEVPFEMVRPNKETTKMNVGMFKKSTGWPGVTSVHARDACWLVYGL